MSIESILRGFQKSDQYATLREKLKSPGSARLYLNGLTGSSASFIASAIILEQKKGIHLFLIPEKEDAAYFLNDLENITGKMTVQEQLLPVVFFPAPHNKKNDVEGDNANILLRAEALQKIDEVQKNSGSLIIVTYPEALTYKVPTFQQISKNTLSIKVGEKLSINFMIDVLIEYDFERVDYVLQPGQFSVRGGIVDIFSFGNDLPYRVELFGDEVESIRSFDAGTQLSVNTFSSATIIPNVQGNLLMKEQQSVLESISNEAFIWAKDIDISLDKIQKENESPLNIGSDQVITKDIFIEQLSPLPVIEFGTHSFYNGERISFECKPQPAFNKNFNLLFQHLTENTKKGITNYIFCDTEKQSERLKSILKDLTVKQPNSKEGHIEFNPIYLSLHEGFIDTNSKVACYTDHQIFERYHRFRLKSTGYKKTEALTIRELKGLNPGDYITHIDHGIGRFGGLEKIDVNGKMQEAIRLVYKDNDILYISIHSLHRIAKYAGKDGMVPKSDKLGSQAWANLKQKTKRKVKEIAFDLIKLYAERRGKQGFAFAPDNYLQHELEASFIYEDTPDQFKATKDVKKDMEQEFPMDRLVCGDVGFGKTEVAIRAAFKAVCDSKQVAVLVPTTILAMQHYRTFSERLKDLPCKIDYINRFKSTKEQNETIDKTSKGQIDILIGTHRIVSKDIKFKDLGLLIVDEEQKFGVGVKEKLKTIRVNVDTLTLTATPIPRTLQFSLMGARDLSIINTPPANRYPVQTELHSFNEDVIREAIMFEITRGGQVFVVQNRISGLIELQILIKKLCPNVKSVIAHGQMDGDKLEETMLQFINGEFDVLISTSIVESGLDISNANTMIIFDAQLFGLSDLHQLRGRVGRSNRKAFCYLFAPPPSVLTQEARKRLTALTEFTELGSGFNIAMRDLDIRGAGDVLGAEQSGFITDIGYEMYQKILDEALTELRNEQPVEEKLAVDSSQLANKENQPTSSNHQFTNSPNRQFISDCVIDTDMSILIPDEYVNGIPERINLYKELDETKTEEALLEFETKLRDRFGPIPTPTLELLNTVRLRWTAMKLGIEKLILKNGKMTGYFISNQNSPYYQSEIFSKVLHFVQKNPFLCKMKEGNNKLSLTFENVKDIKGARDLLNKMS